MFYLDWKKNLKQDTFSTHTPPLFLASFLVFGADFCSAVMGSVPEPVMLGQDAKLAFCCYASSANLLSAVWSVRDTFFWQCAKLIGVYMRLKASSCMVPHLRTGFISTWTQLCHAAVGWIWFCQTYARKWHFASWKSLSVLNKGRRFFGISLLCTSPWVLPSALSLLRFCSVAPNHFVHPLWWLC